MHLFPFLLSPFSFLLSPFSFLLSPFSFLLSPFSFLLSPFSLSLSKQLTPPPHPQSKKDAKDYMKTGNVAYSVEAPLHTVKNKPKRARIPPPPIDREARIAKPKMPTIIPFPMQKPKTKAKSKKKLKLVPPGTIPLVSSVFSIDSLATIISSTSTTTYNTNPKPKPKLKGIVNSVSTSSLVSLSSFASNSNSTATSNSKNNNGKHPPPPPNYYSSKEYLESEQYIYDTTPVMVFERVGELSLSDDLITCDDQIEEIRIANVQLCWDGRSPSNDAAPMSKYFNRLIGESVKTRTQKKKQKVSEKCIFLNEMFSLFSNYKF